MKILNASVMIIAAITLSSFFSACNGNENNQHDHGDMGHMSNEDMSTSKGDKPMQADIDPLMNSYLAIKNALVEDDAKAAEEASKKMMDMQGVNGAMKSSLKEIAGSENLKQQRNSFSELSNHIYKMAKGGEMKGMALYWKHCPMARNNEGANWLSINKEISNPYMGQKMLKCGSVQETLKQ